MNSVGCPEDETLPNATHRATGPSGVHAGDASEVGQLFGALAVVRTLLDVPHPLETGWAERFIHDYRRAFEAGESIAFAVVLRAGGHLVGGILLKLNPRDDNGELAYLVGAPYWGRGYATEAAKEVVRYGFEELGLHRIHANLLGNNPASGKVLWKVGMSYEGTRPEHGATKYNPRPGNTTTIYKE